MSKHSKRGSKDMEEEFELPVGLMGLGMGMNNFITFNEEPMKNIIEVHLRGYFPDAEDCTRQLTELKKYSDKYPEAHVYINSFGGDLATCVEIISILDTFDYVVTIATGACMSAGLIVWAAGDVRVVQRYASIMYHREAYGIAAKTDQHLDLAKHNALQFEVLKEQILDGILTDAEFEKGAYTEVYLTANELISRDVAISWNDFIEISLKAHCETRQVVMVDGKSYMLDGIEAFEIKDMTIGNNTYNIYDLVYRQDAEPYDTINPETLEESTTTEEVVENES